MGVVYRAQDKWSGQPCAVKVLEATSNARRFLREAQILARLAHPGVVRYVGHGMSPAGALFLAMEWVEGTDLEQRLTEGPLTLQEALEVGCRLAETLDAVHGAGIVHRDLKPSNVFLPQGKLELAKLGDFGIAHLSATRHATSTLTRTGVVVGTPGYLSPEQLRGGELDARADLFALGCVLFEALTGRPAFWADSLLALLTKIALDAPPRATDARPGLPARLDALIASLLEKEPERRPSSASDVRLALEAIRTSERDRDTVEVPRPVLGTRELRLVPVVVCPQQNGVNSDVNEPSTVSRPQLSLIAQSAGVRVELLPDGSIIGVPDLLSEAPKEQALRAARLAQMLVSAFGARPMAIVTGRMAVTAGLSVSDVVDRALALIERAPPLSIAVDEASASLLEPRFTVERAGEQFRLGQEVLDEHGPRHLLGRRTPFVGRQREFSLLFSTLEACLDESYARAMLVSGLPGIGKSRLLSELLSEGRARFPGLSVLVARGDPALSGQPFSLLGGSLRRTAQIQADDGVEERLAKLREWSERAGALSAETQAFLGELMGLELPDSLEPRLRAARRDPPLMSALVRAAFVDWTRAAAGQRGLLLALDDLHWGDPPSVQLVDAALGELPNAPLFVMTLGRPEVKDAYPSLFETRDIAELKLGRLSKRASEELVAAILGDGASATLVTAIVERAEGNAFFLEELIRAGASGVSELPDTVLGVMESRLTELETEARLVLRAASIFGESCWPSGVSSVLGGESAISDVAGWLGALASREILVRAPLSRFAEQAEYAFRHALLRDASYATFPELDRQKAHARAASWLEAHGEGAAIVLANHWERALDLPRAARALVVAVEQALRGNDLESAIALGERAEKMGASGAELGRVRLLESEAYTWMGSPDQALRAASQAIELTTQRDASWYAALATAVEAAMLVGDPDAVSRLLRELESEQLEASLTVAESRAAALGRISFALVLLGRAEEAEDVLKKADALREQYELSDPMTLAHLSHARGARAMIERKLEEAVRHYGDAAEAFERSGALRPASGARSNVAAMYLEMGAAELALEALDLAMNAAERVGARYTLSLARLNRGIALGRVGETKRAAQLLGEVREELERQGDRRLVASAACARSEVLLESGELAEAEAEAKRAVAASDGLPSCRAAALATLASVLLGKGDPASALSAAREADRERAQATMEEREVLLDLVLSEAEWACGLCDSARQRIFRVAAGLSARAAEFASPERRRDFLEGVPEHRRALALSTRLRPPA